MQSVQDRQKGLLFYDNIGGDTKASGSAGDTLAPAACFERAIHFPFYYGEVLRSQIESVL